MPIITVEASAGRSLEQKRRLVKDITDAVVKNYKVTPDVVTIVIRSCRRAPRKSRHSEVR